MEINVIRLEDVEPYLEYIKLERELTVGLVRIKELTEWKLKRVNDLKRISERLLLLRQKHKFKTKKEIVKEIKKFAR